MCLKRFYLSGQRTFGDHGCEVIVRSTVQLLKEQLGDIKVLVPSDDVECDSAQWPEADKPSLYATVYPILGVFPTLSHSASDSETCGIPIPCQPGGECK